MPNSGLSRCLGVSPDLGNAIPGLSVWLVYFKTADSKLAVLSLNFYKGAVISFNSASLLTSFTLNFSSTTSKDALSFPKFNAFTTQWPSYFVLSYRTSADFLGEDIDKVQVVAVSNNFGKTAGDLLVSGLSNQTPSMTITS